MAERPRPIGRFFPFASDGAMVAGSAGHAVPPTQAPLPIQTREPPTRSVGGILQELFAQGIAGPVVQERPATEPIDDNALIEARMRALAAQEATVFVRTDTSVTRGRLAPIFSDGPFPLHLVLPQPLPDTPFELDVEGYNSLYRFPVERLVRIGEHVAVPLPTRIVRLQHRRSRRAAAPAGFVASFHHPFLPELHVRRPVRDLSRNGLCFEIRVDQDILAPGLKIRDLVVTTPGGATLCFDATVRILHPPRDGRGAAAGVRLSPNSALDATRWEQIVGEVLHPATQLGATWSEDSWALYTASGYFSLSGKSQPHFATLKAPFSAVTRKLDTAPQVGCQVTWPSERGVEASLSVLKLYTHTWFGFQMAKLPGDAPDGTPGRRLLREIHLRAYEHAQADPELKWTMGLVQESARWSKLVHYDLPKRYVDSGLACVYDFHALEIDAIAPRPAPGIEVGPATEEERALLLAYVGRARPWAYREALDLVPERFSLSTLRGQWAAAGFHRERELLVARKDGRPLAGAVVESAEPGLHLFNLLDTARLYPLTPDGTDVYGALLGGAAAWYRARGRASFCCLLEDGCAASAAAFSPRDLGRGSLTVLSTELLPSFLEHVNEVTAPRLRRA